jgi:hypothetical protein
MITDGSDSVQGVSRFHLARDIGQIQETLAMFDRVAAYEKSAKAAFATAPGPAKIPQEYSDGIAAGKALGLDISELHLNTSLNDNLLWPTNFSSEPGHAKAPGYLVPNGFAIAMVDGRIWAFRWEKDFAAAAQDWRFSDPDSQFLQSRKALTTLLVSARQAEAGKLTFPNANLNLQIAAWDGVLMAVLLLLGSVGAFIGYIGVKVLGTQRRPKRTA